jgi:hypothetical protein
MIWRNVSLDATRNLLISVNKSLFGFVKPYGLILAIIEVKTIYVCRG